MPTATGVLANDTDPDSRKLTAQLVSGPVNGTLTLKPNGGFAYTPRANFIGTDSFTYRATDGKLNSTPATVSIKVGNPNTARSQTPIRMRPVRTPLSMWWVMRCCPVCWPMTLMPRIRR